MAGLYKRGNVWWGRAQRQGREFRRSLKTTDRQVAKHRFRQWLDDLDAAAWGDKPRRTFDEAVERFILQHFPTIKPASQRRYVVSLKALSDTFAGMQLDKIGKANLSEFETNRRSSAVSAPTIRRDFACLSSLLSSCEEWEWLDDGANPVPSYLKRRAKRGLKEAPARTRYLSDDEESALIEAATPAVQKAIILAIDTGLRREELFSLRHGQIDMQRAVVKTTTETKSGRARMVPLPERSRTILGTNVFYPPSAFVLCHDDGSRYVQMDKGLKGAMRRAGITNLRWHDLRRTAGCRWLQRDGYTMAEVCMFLGHSSVTVTEQRYAFLDAEKAAQKPAHRLADSAG